MSSIQVQSLPAQKLALPSTPIIRIRKPSPECLPLPAIPEAPLETSEVTPAKTPGVRHSVRKGRVQRRKSLGRQTRKPVALPRHMVKEILQTKLSKKKERDKKEKEAGKKEASDMAPSQRRVSSVSSKSSSPEVLPTTPPTTSRSKSKSKSKDIDWADVTDPEERRRIQNRIAQRKFRMQFPFSSPYKCCTDLEVGEKTRDNKEKAEREARNQQYAGNSYRTPAAEDFMNDTESDGLPWGGLNFGHAVLRGHESEGRRSSGRGTYVADDSLQTHAPNLAPVSAPTPFMMPYSQALPQAAPSFGSSGADDVYMEEANYRYGATIPTFPPLPPHQ